jgi:hypothetical protein
MMAKLKAYGAEMDAAHEEMMARLKAGQKEMKEDIPDKTDGRQEEMRAHMASLTSRIEDNSEKFEVLPSTLVSRMDAHRERMMVCQEATKACMGKTEARIETG